MGLAGKYDIPKDICVGDFIAADLSYYFEEKKRNRTRINYTVFEVKCIQITNNNIVYQGEGYNVELDLTRPETHRRVFRCPLTPRFRRGDDVDYTEEGEHWLDVKLWRGTVQGVFYQTIAGAGDTTLLYDITRVDHNDPLFPYRGARVREECLQIPTITDASVESSVPVYHVHVYEIARKYEANICTGNRQYVENTAESLVRTGDMKEVAKDCAYIVRVFDGPRPL